MSVCLNISVFCKSCEPICEPRNYTLTIKTETISRLVFSSQILQNAEINIVLHWKFWRKYRSVSHLLSCNRLSPSTSFSLLFRQNFGENVPPPFRRPCWVQIDFLAVHIAIRRYLTINCLIYLCRHHIGTCTCTFLLFQGRVIKEQNGEYQGNLLNHLPCWIPSFGKF